MIYLIEKNQNYTDNISISIFNNFKSKTPEFFNCNIFGLKKHGIQKNIEKKDRKYMIINELITRQGRKRENFKIPMLYGLDIDLKEPDVQYLFTKDLGCENLKQAMKKCINHFKNDPCCLYADLSASCDFIFDVNGNAIPEKKYGIHAIYCTISDNHINNNYTYKGDDLKLVEIEMQSKMEVVFKYLNENGLNLTYHGQNSVNYVDTAMNGVQQGFYTGNGLKYHFNSNPSFITYTIQNYLNIPEKDRLCNKGKTVIYKSKTAKNSLKTSEKKDINNSNQDSNSKLKNEKFIDDLYQYYRHHKKDKIICDRLKDIFKTQFSHHTTCFSTFCACLSLSKKHKKFVHIILKHNYEGQSHTEDFKTYKNFESFLKTLTNYKSQQLFSNLFSEINIKLINFNHHQKTKQNKDLFNKNYDKIITYTNYINEKEMDIFKIFDDNKKIVIAGRAGGGKSTVLMDYAVKCLNERKYNNVLYVITKNSNLTQIQQIFLKRFPFLADRLFLNFDKNYYNPTKNYHPDGVIILSSTPKMGDLKNIDLIIYDEVHNAVNFSAQIKSNVCKSKKTIYCSATVENYLIFESDFYYLYLQKNKDKKQHVNLVYTSNKFEALESIIKGKNKVLIYLNSINLINQFITDYYKNNNIQYTVMSSNTAKNDDIKTMIESEYLTSDKMIVTSFYSDGINFKNVNWDIVVYVDSINESPANIYQTFNRLRSSTPELYIITNKRKNDVCREKIDYKVFSNEGVKDIIFKNLQKQVDDLNKYSDLEQDIMKNDYVSKNKKGDYYINYDLKKKEFFEKNFLKYYQFNEDIRLQVLKYYFNLTILSYNTNNSQMFERDNIGKDFYLKNTNKILRVLDISKEDLKKDRFNLSELIVNNNIDEKDIFLKNINYFKKLYYKINELKELNIPLYGKNQSFLYKKQITFEQKRWNNFLDRISKKRIGCVSIKDANELGIMDKQYYATYIFLHNYIIQNNLYNNGIRRSVKKTKNSLKKDIKKTFYYFDPSIVLNHILSHGNYSTFSILGEKVFKIKKSEKGINTSDFKKWLKTGCNFFDIYKKDTKKKTVTKTGKEKRVFDTFFILKFENQII